MPQGAGRSKAFSGSKKKAQLQAKRQKNATKPSRGEKVDAIFGAQRPHEDANPATTSVSSLVTGLDIQKNISGQIMQDIALPSGAGQGRNRFNLRFNTESKEEIQKLRQQATQKIKPCGEWEMECGSEDFFTDALTFPQRPRWDHLKSKAALETHESQYFHDYVQSLFQTHDDLSYFELNLETWRQLWRVIEMSDVILVTVDIRYSAAMFPPSLFQFIRDQGKDVILILNKVDLVPVGLTLAWREYFVSKYPGLRVTFFTSCPTYNLRTNFMTEQTGLQHRRLRGRISMVKEGAQQVWEACQAIVQEAGADVDLETWKTLIMESDQNDQPGEPEQMIKAQVAKEEVLPQTQTQRFQDQILTIGMVGQPNAGKSSLINSLMGKRVVSVSKTPGHTKHFQTIFITKSVKLCDCPGLVFPSKVPKALQSIMGSYPISQIRELFSVVQFLARRVDLLQVLKLTHPDKKPNEPWSAFDICEAWAFKRGYITARSNRPDINRAANHILRMALEGKICLAYYPVGYVDRRTYWKEHPQCEVIRELLGWNRKAESNARTESDIPVIDSEDEDEDDEGSNVNSDDDRTSDEEVDDRPKVGNKFSLLDAVDDE